jgi:hypothetical protein
MTTRRQFLINCSSLTLAASLAPTSVFAQTSRNLLSGQIGFDAFLTQAGTVFNVLPESLPAAKLKLIEVRLNSLDYPGAHKAADARNEKFSLLFRSGDRPALEQDTYVFDHPEIGRFAMFIVPVRVRGGGHNYYQAIFNRSPC